MKTSRTVRHLAFALSLPLRARGILSARAQAFVPRLRLHLPDRFYHGLIGALCLSWVSLGSALAQTYNARDEFALTQGGTTGVWRYGYTPGPTNNAFSEYPNTGSRNVCGTNNYAAWSDSAIGGEPVIGANVSGSTIVCGSYQLPPDFLDLHPGAAGQRSVLRWIAPAAGAYQVKGVFRGIITTSDDVKIIKNESAATIFSGFINGFGDEKPFDFAVTVQAGDKIDFRLATGPTITIRMILPACRSRSSPQSNSTPGTTSS